MKLTVFMLAALLALAGAVHPARGAVILPRTGQIIFGTGLSRTAVTVTGAAYRLRAKDRVAYAAALSRPARSPWLLLSFSRVYPGRGAQLIERDWIDADEGDRSFADWAPSHVLRPGGTYSLSIRERGRTRAYGSFRVVAR